MRAYAMAKLSVKAGWRDMLSVIDCILYFSEEKKPNNGEDCGIYTINRDYALAAVFDGCGGAGAKKCPKFQNKTEAYIASRAAGKAFLDWADGNDLLRSDPAAELKKQVTAYLRAWKERVGEENGLFGSLFKSFPTTAAALLCHTEGGVLETELFWAGDSRVYLLDTDGLAQLTEDDLDESDAMENLTADSTLTNVINLSTDFTLHTGHLTLDHPGILFAATDGCFGYLTSPMEFEYLLLRTLLRSDCINAAPRGGAAGRTDKPERRTAAKGWINELAAELDERAGDDFSLSGVVYGFHTFNDLKEAFRARGKELFTRYICGLEQQTPEEIREKWYREYKVPYYRYLCRL